MKPKVPTKAVQIALAHQPVTNPDTNPQILGNIHWFRNQEHIKMLYYKTINHQLNPKFI